jgi:hypothetical protein
MSLEVQRVHSARGPHLRRGEYEVPCRCPQVLERNDGYLGEHQGRE